MNIFPAVLLAMSLFGLAVAADKTWPYLVQYLDQATKTQRAIQIYYEVRAK